MGGLARKSTILNDTKENNFNYFVVDAGNLFFKNKTINPGVASDVAKINAETIVSSFNKIGCDAFNVGENDFALGLEYLNELKNNSNFPYISANIKNTSGSFLFNPYKISEKNGVKLGIIGLSSIFKNDNIIVEDPIESLKKIIDFVDSQSDFILLLFDTIESDLNKLHNEKLPIDFIIQSKSKKRSNDGGKKDTPVYSCGDRGKYLYEFDFLYNDIKNEFVDIAKYESTIKLIDRKINNLNKNENQDKPNTDQENHFNKLKEYNSHKKLAENKIEIAENKIIVNKIALDKTIIDDPKILKIVDKANIKKNIINPQPKTPNPPHGHPGHRHGH